MLTPQSSPYTAPRWVKWGLILAAILILLALTLAIWMYVDINNDRTAGHAKAAELAKKETEITNVESVATYNGEKQINIVQGTTESEENILVFLNLEDETILDTIPLEETMSQDGMKQQWSQSCSSCEFRDIQYAYEEGEPVFQLTYIDEQNRYVMDYFTLTGESFDQRFAFRQNK